MRRFHGDNLLVVYVLPPTVVLFKVMNITTPQGHSNTLLTDTANEIWQPQAITAPWRLHAELLIATLCTAGVVLQLRKEI